MDERKNAYGSHSHQVTDEGVLIPKVYLHDASQIEIVVTKEYVLVRPKLSEPESVQTEQTIEELNRRYSFIGIGHTRDPQASVNAKEILEREIKRESGWSLD